MHINYELNISLYKNRSCEITKFAKVFNFENFEKTKKKIKMPYKSRIRGRASYARSVPSYLRKYRSRMAAGPKAYGKQGSFTVGGRFKRILLKGQERNFVDTGQLTKACDTTGTITLLNVIPQGVTVSQRIGKKALMKTIQLKGFFYPNASATVNNAGAALIYDKMSNGAAIPAVTDIFVSVNPNDMLNDANSNRFVVLKRWSCVLSGTLSATGPYTDVQSADIDDYIKLEKEIEWNPSAATGVQATINKGALYMVTYGSAAAGVTASTFQYYSRIRFTEDY